MKLIDMFGLIMKSMIKNRIKALCIIIMMIIAFLTIEFSIFLSSNYLIRPYVYSSITSDRTDRIYALSMDKYYFSDYSDEIYTSMADICSMIDAIDEKDNISSGSYWVMENEDDSNVFFVSLSLLGYGKMGKLTSDMLAADINTGYPGMAVGYDIADKYPVGSFYEDSDIIYEVRYMMPKGSKWISDIADSDNLYIDLDNMLVACNDYLLDMDSMNIINGLTSVVVTANNEAAASEIVKIVDDASSEYHIDVYNINSLKDIVTWDIKHMRDLPEEIYIAIFLFLCIVTAFLVVRIVLMYLDRRNIGILLTNGYSRREICILYSVKNTMGLLVSYAASLCIWNIINAICFDYISSINWVFIPITFVIFVLVLLVSCYIICKYIRELNIVGNIGRDSV